LDICIALPSFLLQLSSVLSTYSDTMLDLNSYSRLSTSDPSNSLVSSADEGVQDCPVAEDKALASEPRRWIPLALGIVNLCCVGIILGLFIRLGQSTVQAVPNVKWEYTSNKNHLLKQTSYYCMHQNISSKRSPGSQALTTSQLLTLIGSNFRSKMSRLTAVSSQQPSLYQSSSRGLAQR